MIERISRSIKRIDLNHQNYDNTLDDTECLEVNLQGILEVLFQVYQNQMKGEITYD